jgi:colanic acid/amylovoran biosynthesis glycosyltransferase
MITSVSETTGRCKGQCQVAIGMAEGNSLHLVDTYLKVTENWFYRRLRGLKRYPPVVLAQKLEDSENYPLDGVRLLRKYSRWRCGLNRLQWLPFAWFNAYYPELREAKPRIVHSHFAPIATKLRRLRILARQRFKCPTVCSFYGYDLRGLVPGRRWTGFDELLREETAFIVQGPRMAEHMATLGCDPAKIYVNPLGIDLSLFPQRNTRFEGGCLRVLTVGRFVEKKGIGDAVRAVALARRRGADITLTVAGDGALRPALEGLIAAEDAGGFVKLLGAVDYPSLWQLYYNHDVCLAPSMTAADGDTEGGANMCVIEAMAAGMPIVATRHADTPSTVAEGENAFLADEFRFDQLAEALLELSVSTDLWHSFSLNGRARAHRLFDSQKQATELESIYDKILSRW